MTKTIPLSAAFLLATSGLCQAADLSLPGNAVMMGDRLEGYTSQRLPIGAFAYGEVPAIWAEGDRRLQAWQTTDSDLTTLQAIAPIKDQLQEQGYDILFECRDVECGGFDFRFAQDMLPEPDMHVNLSDYRFLSAQRMTDDLPEYVTVMVSRNRSRGYVHLTTIGAADAVELIPAVTATKNDATEFLDFVADVEIGSLLESQGVAVLEDLDFEVGSSKLADGDLASLGALADYLNTHPERTVSLVGHTDAVGSMEANIRLSKARALSVREQLIAIFGVSPRQVDAQGVGFLSPVASNMSEDGRSLNRRVEVVLTSTN